MLGDWVIHIFIREAFKIDLRAWFCPGWDNLPGHAAFEILRERWMSIFFELRTTARIFHPILTVLLPGKIIEVIPVVLADRHRTSLFIDQSSLSSEVQNPPESLGSGGWSLSHPSRLCSSLSSCPAPRPHVSIPLRSPGMAWQMNALKIDCLRPL